MIPAQPVAEGYEELARPTDLSKRLRALAAESDGSWAKVSVTGPVVLRQAADEIERYYGGMLAWKQTAEAKDASLAQLAEQGLEALREKILALKLDRNNWAMGVDELDTFEDGYNLAKKTAAALVAASAKGAK